MFGSIEPSQEISELRWFELKWIRDSWFDLNDKHTTTKEGMVKEHQELMSTLIKLEIK